jgi:hypothetical protein
MSRTRFYFRCPSRVQGSKVQGSGFWIQKFQHLSARFGLLYVPVFTSHQTSVFCYLTSEPLNVEPLNQETDT